jgi:hypothetical protein
LKACWLSQLLLGYLPPDRGLWSSELAKKRSQYKQFKEELLMNPVSHSPDFEASISNFMKYCFVGMTWNSLTVIEELKKMQYALFSTLKMGLLLLK